MSAVRIIVTQAHPQVPRRIAAAGPGGTGDVGFHLQPLRLEGHVDMADLRGVTDRVRDRIRRFAGQSISETDTRTTLIDPVLRALGWDTEELDEVRREYRRRPADNPVDYALLLLRMPRLFVEAATSMIPSGPSRSSDMRWLPGSNGLS